MNKFIQVLIKYLGIPLLKKLGEWILSLFNDYMERRKIKKEQAAKKKAVDDAKTPEEIRDAHRNNKL